MRKENKELQTEVSKLRNEDGTQKEQMAAEISDLKKKMDLAAVEKAKVEKSIEYEVGKNKRLKADIDAANKNYESVKKQFEEAAVRAKELEMELNEAKEALDEIDEALS